MNKNMLFGVVGGGIVRIAAAMVGLAVASASAQLLDPIERQCITNAVLQRGPVGDFAVVLKYIGSFDEAGDRLQQATDLFVGQGLDRSLQTPEGSDSVAVLVVYQDPKDATNGVPLGIGFTVAGQLDVKPPLVMERLLRSVAVQHLHTGPYVQLGEVHNVIRAALPPDEPPDFPCWVRLLTDPRDPNAPIQTKVIVPVKDKPVLTPTEKLRIANSVSNAGPAKFLIVSQTFQGGARDLERFITILTTNFINQGLGTALPNPDTAPLALFYVNPDESTNSDIEVGFPVTKAVQVGPPLRQQELHWPKTVFYTSEGPYSKLPVVYAEIARLARALPNGGEPFWPAALRVQTNPNTVTSPDQIKNQLIVQIGGPGAAAR